MDQISAYTEPIVKFTRDSIYFFNRCTKPDRKEFNKNAIATAVGFFAMGVLGFVVKLIFVPINNIIVGA